MVGGGNKRIQWIKEGINYNYRGGSSCAKSGGQKRKMIFEFKLYTKNLVHFYNSTQFLHTLYAEFTTRQLLV